MPSITMLASCGSFSCAAVSEEEEDVEDEDLDLFIDGPSLLPSLLFVKPVESFDVGSNSPRERLVGRICPG